MSVPDYLLWNGNLAIAESDVRYALIIWIKPFHQGISPVSYTHLDVYKRQLYERCVNKKG